MSFNAASVATEDAGGVDWVTETLGRIPSATASASPFIAIGSAGRRGGGAVTAAPIIFAEGMRGEATEGDKRSND